MMADSLRRWFEYEGLIYVRPCGRGICLGDVNDDDISDFWPQLEEIMEIFIGYGSSGGESRIRIRFEVLDEEA